MFFLCKFLLVETFLLIPVSLWLCFSIFNFIEPYYIYLFYDVDSLSQFGRLIICFDVSCHLTLFVVLKSVLITCTAFNIPSAAEYIKELKPKIESHLEEKGIGLLTILTDEDVQRNDSKIDTYLSSERQGALLSGYPYIQGLEFNTVFAIVDESEGERKVQEVPILCSFINMALRAKLNLAMILMRPYTNFDPDLD